MDDVGRGVRTNTPLHDGPATSSEIESQPAENQSDEVRLFEVLAHEVRPRRMVDIGAHKGTMFLPFLEAGWKIDAFEPLRSNFDWLKEQFAHSDAIVLHSEAVSSSSGTKPFHLATTPDGKGLHEFYHSLEEIGDDEYHRKGETVQVVTVSLDDLVEQGALPTEVGFIKIDTEGHDLEVLKGASRLGAAVVCVEFWCPGHPQGPSPAPPDEIVRLMNGRGYPYYIVVEHDLSDITRFKSSMTEVLPDAWGNLLFFRQELGPFITCWKWWSSRLQTELAETKQALVDKEAVIQRQAEGVNSLRAELGRLEAELEKLRDQLNSLMAQLKAVRSMGGAARNLVREIRRTLGVLRGKAR
jgi:FkbM family methyltransferase